MVSDESSPSQANKNTFTGPQGKSAYSLSLSPSSLMTHPLTETKNMEDYEKAGCSKKHKKKHYLEAKTHI